MIVVDASAVLELLLSGDRAPGLQDLLLDEEPVLVPQLLDLDVLQVLRRWNLGGALDARRSWHALEDLVGLPFARQPHDLLAERIWELRHNLNAYAAAYLALAELADARLVTLDTGLARVAAKTVEVVAL